jgi:ubiquinone/menaquinone biosynthesis C-methylase UbiE
MPAFRASRTPGMSGAPGLFIISHSITLLSMKSPRFFRIFLGLALLAMAAGQLSAQTKTDTAKEKTTTSSKTPQRYETRERHDPDGIGKFYLGREIAHVMGHQGADWLERPERIDEEKPDRLVELLKLKPGDKVADVGAGTGYISERLSKKVGPAGKVYATDIQQEMLDLLGEKMKAKNIANIVPVLGTIENSKLPADTLDLVIMVDVYHEFSHPYEMLASIRDALKPGGRVAFVEYREEDPTVPIKPVHKMSVLQVKKEAAAAGLEFVELIRSLPRQHVILFQRPVQNAEPAAVESK